MFLFFYWEGGSEHSNLIENFRVIFNSGCYFASSAGAKTSGDEFALIMFVDLCFSRTILI